tara:strand:+ start:353 stop:583 length:231 start_codon:yes stop_codon:yes gene_type:complete
MFGKGKSKATATGKFIMAAGRAVGNIHPPKGSESLKGRGSAPKSAPVKSDPDSRPTSPLFTKSGRTYTGKGDVKLP